MSEIKFVEWPATPRFFRDVVITEKIDGINAAIHIKEVDKPDWDQTDYTIIRANLKWYYVAAQTRTHLITRKKDTAGLAFWVDYNAFELFKILGPGTHFGEWWGAGIGRGYGCTGNTFSLFNTARWKDVSSYLRFGHLTSVPVLYEGHMHPQLVSASLEALQLYGSAAAPGYRKPEGVCLFHTASNQIFKATIENDAKGKKAAK